MNDNSGLVLLGGALLLTVAMIFCLSHEHYSYRPLDPLIIPYPYPRPVVPVPYPAPYNPYHPHPCEV